MIASKIAKGEEITITDLDYLMEVLHPTFVEVDGCIFFQPHFDKENYNQHWYRLVSKDRQKIEHTLNHVHLNDLISDVNSQRLLGERIQKIWFKELKEHFPEKNFHIELYQHEGDWILTFCQLIA